MWKTFIYEKVPWMGTLCRKVSKQKPKWPNQFSLEYKAREIERERRRQSDECVWDRNEKMNKKKAEHIQSKIYATKLIYFNLWFCRLSPRRSCSISTTRCTTTESNNESNEWSCYRQPIRFGRRFWTIVFSSYAVWERVHSKWKFK